MQTIILFFFKPNKISYKKQNSFYKYFLLKISNCPNLKNKYWLGNLMVYDLKNVDGKVPTLKGHENNCVNFLDLKKVTILHHWS